MPSAVLAAPHLRRREKSRDELSSRRRTFRAGDEIQLCDGQAWVLPAQPEQSELSQAVFGRDYAGLIKAILEAEDYSERCIAELSLAIFLLEHNYDLSPLDYHNLLEPGTETGRSSDWRGPFHEIVNQHILAFLETRYDSGEQ
jgi:hypothetical protein